MPVLIPTMTTTAESLGDYRLRHEPQPLILYHRTSSNDIPPLLNPPLTRRPTDIYSPRLRRCTIYYDTNATTVERPCNDVTGRRSGDDRRAVDRGGDGRPLSPLRNWMDGRGRRADGRGLIWGLVQCRTGCSIIVGTIVVVVIMMLIIVVMVMVMVVARLMTPVCSQIITTRRYFEVHPTGVPLKNNPPGPSHIAVLLHRTRPPHTHPKKLYLAQNNLLPQRRHLPCCYCTVIIDQLTVVAVVDMVESLLG